MLGRSSYFASIECPLYTSGLCERVHCHFRHDRATPSAPVVGYTGTIGNVSTRTPLINDTPTAHAADDYQESIDGVGGYVAHIDPTPTDAIGRDVGRIQVVSCTCYFSSLQMLQVLPEVTTITDPTQVIEYTATIDDSINNATNTSGSAHGDKRDRRKKRQHESGAGVFSVKKPKGVGVCAGGSAHTRTQTPATRVAT
jgi:hypothetical protein